MNRDDVVLLQGVASSETVKYVTELPGGGFGTVDATLRRRKWAVTDPTAQRLVAEQELGDLTAYPPCCLQWWINPEQNSAVLVAYRQPSIAA